MSLAIPYLNVLDTACRQASAGRSSLSLHNDTEVTVSVDARRHVVVLLSGGARRDFSLWLEACQNLAMPGANGLETSRPCNAPYRISLKPRP